MRNPIRRFKEINEFFEATGFEMRTDIPDFSVFSFDDFSENGIMSMQPYQKDFYHITLVLNANNAEITIDEQHNTIQENFLYFLSPEHIFSWQRDFDIKGLTVFFKPSFLNFYTGSFEKDFSFFDLADSNIIALSPSKIEEVLEDFKKLYKEFHTPSVYREQILQTLVLTLLYKFKGIQEEFSAEDVLPSKKQTLVFKFKNLVNNLFITYKQVGDYADKLFISANTLNKIVKDLTGKTAKEIINDKVILESKKMLIYTSNDISEIAFTIGFDEPTHFIRFFKTHTQRTPKEYRIQKG
ncbi:Helix-turn-helix domain-containing protein [Flavobacterium fluvii]|uniref:Helix-turn-helix domain-containing protein n=1 Tax=Flavobacterium fluvii TaxID=468056 RepID=A0A1M5L7E0_9FLAO|nr:helix-turn-helix domain-containing protein [Flavobacterium fluvii]SHG60957.1 Helix-turn-helix domain-containing protein [Flavobacterium fluvii]